MATNDDRAERLAAALRSNLHRRKAQAREAADQPPTTSDPSDTQAPAVA